MTVEQELQEREMTAKAIAELTTLNEKLELCKAFQGLLIAMAEGAKSGVQEDEPIEGAMVVFLGNRNSHHLEFTGKFNPYAAYGACMDAMFEVRDLDQQGKAGRIVKSFVGNLESLGAQIEKDATNPDIQ